MKKLIAFVTLVAVAGSAAHGQGLINFANAAVGVNAPVTDLSGVKLSGGAYAADLFYGPVGTSAAALTDLGLAASFSSIPAQAGYFIGGGVTLPVPGGQAYEFEVRVWQTAAGASWAAATGGGIGSLSTYVGHGGTQWGLSDIFRVIPSTAPSPSASLVGLNAFQLNPSFPPPPPIPEPTTLALGGLGSAVLLLFRRRK